MLWRRLKKAFERWLDDEPKLTDEQHAIRRSRKGASVQGLGRNREVTDRSRPQVPEV